jgi:hypothetical protein
MRIHGPVSGRRRRKVILLAQALASVGERRVGVSSVASGFRRFLPLAGSVITRVPAVLAYLSVFPTGVAAPYSMPDLGMCSVLLLQVIIQSHFQFRLKYPAVLLLSRPR